MEFIVRAEVTCTGPRDVKIEMKSPRHSQVMHHKADRSPSFPHPCVDHVPTTSPFIKEVLPMLPLDDHSEIRGQIYLLVRAEPGVSTKSICRNLGIGWGTAIHHLNVLSRRGRLESRRVGQYRHWYLFGTVTPFESRATSLLRHPAARAVYDAVRRTPGSNQATIARGLGKDPSAVSRQAKRLEDAGLLWRDRSPKGYRCFARRP